MINNIQVKEHPNMFSESKALLLGSSLWCELLDKGYADVETSAFHIHIPLLAAYKDDECIGIISYDVYTDKSVWVYLSGVHKEFRKQGVWKILWEHLIELMKEKGITTILGGTSIHNQDMIKAYESAGRKPHSITYRYDIVD